MTRICVAGGTGQVGREVVRQALDAGHSVAVLSRRPPAAGTAGGGAEYFRADVTTGEGLAAALAGADVVIDCLEGRSGKARKNFADGGARLLAAAQEAGTARAVMLSIVNCDRSSYAFYRSKAAKEHVYELSGLETVVMRATQFHSLLAMMFGAGSRVRVIPVVRGARFQPVSPADVAAMLLESALEPEPEPAPATPEPARPRHHVLTIGGPEAKDMADFAREWQRATGAKGHLVRLPLPGAMGRYLRAGLNLVPDARHGTETFRGWLANHADSL
ncbi:SDR family oxidoreductase [Arthrobacter sp. H-02-3]|uniref:SDR family oxidoreductase n=1 Tax=Arthrobacter sp. H-02-3 TaxID=2703675 RepID=UPI000DD2281D|nr:NAD(P)H-binding protein [Arthrobacter sp. H-02-3]PVZ60913.1 NmrA family transcriptional regulator [Arthrobacter sp. H-02-3]